MLYHKVRRIHDSWKNNKVVLILIIIAFFGGILGSTFILPQISRTNIFSDIYQGILKGVSGTIR